MKTIIIIGLISIIVSYNLNKILMILFKGIANFLNSSDYKITKFSGILINNVFFSFPSLSSRYI